MPSQTVDIPFPFGGLSENYAFGSQEPGTTRSTLNMRPLDPDTGRIRGAQRAGLSKYNENELDSATAPAKVADLAVVVGNESLLTYAEAAGTSPPTGAKTVTRVGSGQGVAQGAWIETDAFGSIYILDATAGVKKVNPDGYTLATIVPPVDLVANDVRLRALAVDEVGNVYIGAGDGTDFGITTTLAIQERSRVWAYRINFDGTYELAWEWEDPAATVRFVEALAIVGDTLYVALYGKHGAVGDAVHIYEEVTLDEAPEEPVGGQVITTANGLDAAPRALAVRDDGIVYVCGDNYAAVQWLSKWDPRESTPLVSELTQAATGAIGMAVALGEKTDDGQYVYSAGIKQPGATPSADNVEVRRILDDGTLNKSGTGTWSKDPSPATAVNENDQAPLRMAVDEDYNLYVPWSGGLTAANPQLIVFQDSDGTELYTYDQSTPDFAGKAVALPPGKPDYGADAVDVTEFAYLAHQSVTITDIIGHIIRLVSVTQTTGAQRTHVTLGVAAGDIIKFDATTAVPAPVTGGDDALDSTAQYVQSAVLFNRLYYTDGISYKKYDVDDDEVTDWTSESEGSIPPRCRLIETWRARIVLARDPEEPQNWHMSAVGNPSDWNGLPAIPRATQAISGNNAKAGLVPDIVNCIIPYSDDLLFFGGDRSIWRLTGDPMLGGQLDFVTDETGIAFGRPYTKDPYGNLYFFGSRGAVYVMGPGSPSPQPLSDNRLQRRFQDVDLSTYYIRLVWNYRDDGLHVFQLPYGAGGTVVSHWFWSRKTASWWEDQFGDATVQPTAVLLFDGDDPADRVILLGCEDGFVRKWDEAVKGDDGNRIDAYFTVGPIAPVRPAGGIRTGYDGLTVILARDQDGCSYEVFVDEEPDAPLSEPVATGVLGPGRNPTLLERWSGDTCYLRFRNVSATERFAYETASVRVSPQGMKAVR